MGHSFSEPKQILEMMEANLEWFKKHIGKEL